MILWFKCSLNFNAFTVFNVLLDLIDRDFSEFYFQMHSIHVNILY